MLGKISIFDLRSDATFDRGESDPDDEGEDPTHNLAKYRHKIEHLNRDLHDLIDC